jgi:hypothetical protein
VEITAMRKFLSILGAIFLVLLVVLGIGIFIVARNGAALDAESKAYVDDAVITIAAHWSPDELMKRASLHLRQTVKRDDIEGLFGAAMTALGPLVDYQGAKGTSLVTATALTGTTITASYVAQAKFMKGSAELQVALTKIDGLWKIEGFHINSSELMKTMTGRSS